jgi:hypothetical protein
MKALWGNVLVAAACIPVVAFTPVSANAKGCIKGAIVGGAAGHLAHHTLLGAAAGCVIGHHEAVKAEKAQQEQQEQNQTQQQQTPPSNPAPVSAPPTKQQ